MIVQATLWAALAAIGSGELKELGGPGMGAIRAQAISAHVRFLADDLLEGREPGTRGHALAERFVAAELAALGLEPAGEGGTFFQAVPMRATRIQPRDQRIELRRRGGAPLRLEPEREVVLFSAGHQADVSVDAPLVFAGFGIVAPEYGHDDLAGLELRGKIAVVLFGAPRSDDPAYFPPTAHAWYARSRDKAARLRERGAVGMLVVRTPAAEKIYPWPKLVRQERFGGMEWLDGDRPGTWPAGIPVLGSLTAAAFDRVLALAGAGVDAAGILRRAEGRKLAGFDLELTARVRTRARFRPVTANNVAALYRGSDPSLAREVVAYTAHLDHLGVGEPSGKDAVYNGAVDNASGVAGMLAVARAFVAGPRPPRSVLFLAVTGEEQGYLGSDFFVRRPTVPPGAIVANVNIDTLPFFPARDVVALGHEHSTLGQDARAATEALGVPLSPDPTPELVRFIRSDQLSFVRAGIPALWIRAGFQDERGDPAANAAAMAEYLAKRYHDPSDEWSPALDFDAMARTARAAFLVGLSIATARERPRWNPGDFFERLGAKDGPPTR